MAKSAQQLQQRLQRLREPKSKQQQQLLLQQQIHQKSFNFSTTTSLLIYFVTVLLLCGIANGNGSINAAGNHNYTAVAHSPQTEQRTRRDVSSTGTGVQQSTLVPNVNSVPEEISANKQVLTSPSIGVKQNYDNPFRELNIIKRAPSGFIGMRGKKEDVDDNGFNANAVDWDIDPLYHQAQMKNNDNADYDDAYGNAERYKKAPSAFYGVRGKKFPNQDGIGYSRLSHILRQLEDEEEREAALQDFIGRVAVATAEQNEIIKRAPTGFTGLRGKRRPAYDWVANKWQFNAALNDDADVDAGVGAEKRAPTNAFVGVRGKKDVDNHPEPEDEHQTLFKRSPSDSFGGVGGKRRLGECSNKFVAVRGKKDMTSAEGATAADNLRQRLRYLRNTLPALIYGYGMSSLKRAPSGFVGMRGKRAANVPNEASYMSTAA